MSNLINGRTPDEIKQKLRLCRIESDVYVCPVCPYRDAGSECDADGCNDAIAYIEHLEAQTPRWISVKERLPEQNGDYLIHYRFKKQGKGKGFYSVCFYERTCEKPHFHNEGYCGMYVTHWATLPELPKGE